MPVLTLFDVTIRAGAPPEAQAGYERYRAAVPELVARYGGRYLARANSAAVLEGEPLEGEHRYHVIEFPDAAAARAFWASPEYAALQPLRVGAVDVQALLLTPPGPPPDPAGAPGTTTAAPGAPAPPP